MARRAQIRWRALGEETPESDGCHETDDASQGQKGVEVMRGRVCVMVCNVETQTMVKFRGNIYWLGNMDKIANSN